MNYLGIFRTRSIRACLAIALCVIVMGGCSSERVRPINARSALVFENPGAVEWVRSGNGTPMHRRYEFARNDDSMRAVRPGTILATRQWPEARAPRERRVRFRYWEQR